MLQAHAKSLQGKRVGEPGCQSAISTPIVTDSAGFFDTTGSCARRFFLDNVAGWILELDRGQGIPFEGNYSQWLEARARRMAGERKQQAGLQRAIDDELEFVRSKAKGQQKKGKARMRRYDELVSKVLACPAIHSQKFARPTWVGTERGPHCQERRFSLVCRYDEQVSRYLRLLPTSALRKLQAHRAVHGKRCPLPARQGLWCIHGM